jgi:hypothetical protein
MSLTRAFLAKPRIQTGPVALAIVSFCWLSIVWKLNLGMIPVSSDGAPSFQLQLRLNQTDGEEESKLPITAAKGRISEHHGGLPVHDDRDTESTGTLNTLPARFRGETFRSYAHCTRHNSGITEVDESWKLRSCRFTNLCFDVATKRYVVFYDKYERKDIRTSLDVSPESNESLAVAIGGINPRWDSKSGFDKGSWKVKWFPDVRPASQIPSTYLQLEDSTLLVPFHSFAGHNVGHMLWDDFYPIWRLVHLFRFVESDDSDARWLLIRHVLELTLYASCDIRRNKRMQCTSNFFKFLPLLGIKSESFSSSKRVELSSIKSGMFTNTTLVCAKHAVAGLGMLTDHGRHDHGWEPTSSWIPHNLGTGRQFYDFSCFVNRNVEKAFGAPQLTLTPSLVANKPQIIFSLMSSQDWDRRLDFAFQIEALRKELSTDEAKIRSYTLWNMTLQEQLSAVKSSNIFITACGGGSMTATFLPRGSTLIIFFNPTGGLDFETLKPNGLPARLDWDLLNNAAHLRVHWLPVASMNEEHGLQLFLRLVKHEIRARFRP